MDKEKVFNTILDECLDRIIFKGETPEECLRDYPEQREELGPLLETAVMTGSVSSIIPSQEFKNRARTELLTALQESEAKQHRGFFLFSWQRRLAMTAAVILAAIVVAGGTAFASAGAMPDDFLYPVKIATEKVQLAFTFTTLGKAEAYARMADNRIEEIVYLANQDDTDVEEIEVLANTLNSNLVDIAGLSEKDSQNERAVRTEDEGQSVTMAAMSEKTAESDEMLGLDTGGGLGSEPPPSDTITEEESTGSITADDSIYGDDADQDSNDVPDETVSVLVEPVKPEINVEIPPTKITVSPATAGSTDPKLALNATIVEQATTNISKLHQLLNVVPASVRPVILKAIELSQNGYDIAIDSLNK